jgi:hypothetical protein
VLGHTRVQVMKLLAQQLRPADKVRVTLMCDTTTAWYSGMLPACLAQIYHPSGTTACARACRHTAGTADRDWGRTAD